MDENQEQKPQQTFSERMKESQQAATPAQGEGVPPAQSPKDPSGGVNKYYIIVGVVILIIISGALYRAFLLPELEKPIVTGIERFVDIVVHEDTWAFTPEFLEVDQGDKLIFSIVNKDDYDHGFAIDAFGISQRMPALSTIQIDFIVTKGGNFPYYCSVSCGSGIVDGEKRGHFDQIGLLHVKSIISETSGIDTSKTIDFAAEARRSAMIKEASRASGVAEDEIKIDVDNVEWEQTAESLDTLVGVDYQALYYDPTAGGDRVWIFIDTTTGEVIK